MDRDSDASFTHLAQCTIHPHKLYKLACVCEGIASKDRGQLASQQVPIFAYQIRGFAVYAHWCYCTAYGQELQDESFLHRRIHFLNGACTFLAELMRSPKDVEQFFMDLAQSTVLRGESYKSPFFWEWGVGHASSNHTVRSYKHRKWSMLLPPVLMTPLIMPPADISQRRGYKFSVPLAGVHQNMANTDCIDIVVFNPLAARRDIACGPEDILGIKTCFVEIEKLLLDCSAHEEWWQNSLWQLYVHAVPFFLDLE